MWTYWGLLFDLPHWLIRLLNIIELICYMLLWCRVVSVNSEDMRAWDTNWTNHSENSGMFSVTSILPFYFCLISTDRRKEDAIQICKEREQRDGPGFTVEICSMAEFCWLHHLVLYSPEDIPWDKDLRQVIYSKGESRKHWWGVRKWVRD